MTFIISEPQLDTIVEAIHGQLNRAGIELNIAQQHDMGLALDHLFESQFGISVRRSVSFEALEGSQLQAWMDYARSLQKGRGVDVEQITTEQTAREARDLFEAFSGMLPHGLGNPIPSDSLFAAKVLWSMFSNTPVDSADCITEPFLHFEAGTDRFVVFRWFEKRFNCSVAKDLMGYGSRGKGRG